MIEETGVVTKITGITATVKVQKRGMCDGCKAQGTCSSTPEGMEIEAINSVQAKEGQTVKVAMRPQTYLKGTMLVYGIPLVIFIGAAIAGKNIGEKYFMDVSSDLMAAIFAFAGLIISLLVVKLWSSKLESKTEYKPFIEEIIC